MTASTTQHANPRHAARVGTLPSLLVGFLLSIAASADAQSPTVSLSPATIAAEQGEPFELRLLVDAAAESLSCFSISFEFDPAVLTLVGATEGALFANAAAPTFFARDTDAQGNERVSDCLLGFGTAVVAPGELAVLQFTAHGSGASEVRVIEAVLRDRDRATIDDVTTVNAQVGVGVTSVSGWHRTSELVASPNPSSGRVRLQLTAPSGAAAERTEIDIFDAAGRRIRSLHGEMTWDGRDAVGTSVGTGTYFAVARTRHGSVSTRILLLR